MFIIKVEDGYLKKEKDGYVKTSEIDNAYNFESLIDALRFVEQNELRKIYKDVIVAQYE